MVLVHHYNNATNHRDIVDTRGGGLVGPLCLCPASVHILSSLLIQSLSIHKPPSRLSFQDLFKIMSNISYFCGWSDDNLLKPYCWNRWSCYPHFCRLAGPGLQILQILPFCRIISASARDCDTFITYHGVDFWDWGGRMSTNIFMIVSLLWIHNIYIYSLIELFVSIALKDFFYIWTIYSTLGEHFQTQRFLVKRCI